MAWENLGTCVPIPAGSDLSASQFKFMVINSSGQLAVAGAGVDAAGVMQDQPDAAGIAGSLMVGPGITKVIAGAATTKGGPVAVDSSGRAVNAVSGNFLLGEFLEAAGNANERVTILFHKGGRL